MARLALLVAPLCALASASSDSETLSRGHIVVFKELSAKGTSDVLVKDKNFTVTYTVLNLGEGPAFEVKVQDEWPRNNFVLLEGATEGAWDVLRSGANESFSCVMVPTVIGQMQTARATVNYKYRASDEFAVEESDGDAEEDLVDVTSYSTTPGRVQIFPESEYKRWAHTGTMESFFSIGLSLALIIGSYVKWQAAVTANSLGGTKKE